MMEIVCLNGYDERSSKERVCLSIHYLNNTALSGYFMLFWTVLLGVNLSTY